MGRARFKAARNCIRTPLGPSRDACRGISGAFAGGRVLDRRGSPCEQVNFGRGGLPSTLKYAIPVCLVMPEKRTYVKWRREFVEAYKKTCKDNDTPWDYVESFSRDVSKLLRDRTFDKEAKNAMLYGFYDPIVGFRWTDEMMKYWRGVVDKVQGVCIGPDDTLFFCPENITTEKRLLYAHQDNAILLMSIVFLYEGVYKRAVNFIYGLTGDGRYTSHQTYQQAEYLKTHLEFRDVPDRDLRNNIAHMTFRVMDNGDVWVNPSASLPPGFDAASGKPPPDVERYGRDQLIGIYNKSLGALSDLFVAIQYWFFYNHGPQRLFDDEFFEVPGGKRIREAAIMDMARKPTIRHWDRVVERAREDLRRVAGKRTW